MQFCFMAFTISGPHSEFLSKFTNFCSDLLILILVIIKALCFCYVKLEAQHLPLNFIYSYKFFSMQKKK